MRAVFVGASDLSLQTASLLLDRGHEVVVIESNRLRIDEVTDQIDCAILHGDGSKPAILREANPTQTDILFCVTNNDRTNILASLVGRSLGFRRVITAIEDPQFEPICSELGLEDVIVPIRTIGRYLADVTQGIDIVELSTIIKAEARFFAFVLRDESIHHVTDLDLPEEARAVCLYRDQSFMLVNDNSRLHKGDEIVILTHSKHLSELRDRWRPEGTQESAGDPPDLT